MILKDIKYPLGDPINAQIFATGVVKQPLNLLALQSGVNSVLNAPVQSINSAPLGTKSGVNIQAIISALTSQYQGQTNNSTDFGQIGSVVGTVVAGPIGGILGSLSSLFGPDKWASVFPRAINRCLNLLNEIEASYARGGYQSALSFARARKARYERGLLKVNSPNSKRIEHMHINSCAMYINELIKVHTTSTNVVSTTTTAQGQASNNNKVQSEYKFQTWHLLFLPILPLVYFGYKWFKKRK